MLIKNMIHGNNFNYFFALIFFLFCFSSFAENDIVSSPLINLEKLKPSFEETDIDIENATNNQQIKNKNKTNNTQNKFNAVLIGLDKITAKSSNFW